jgi:hypothetical protein
VGKGARLAVTLVLFVLALGGFGAGVRALLSSPQELAFAKGANGQVNVTMQTVGSFGSGPHPTWVSYLIQNPQGQWVHTTMFQVPTNTQVNVTIYQFDSGSPLRNQQIGQVTGTVDPATGRGPAMGAPSPAVLNGKPFSLIDSNDPNGNGVGHTFSIPTLGISVPLYANAGTATLCAAAPCDPTSTAYVHNKVQFSFVTPKGPGNFAWQCFVPCGLAWLFGNAGPMQTVGYMGGFMKVV